MQLNNKSAAVLYSILAEFDDIDLRKVELWSLFKLLQIYFMDIGKSSVVSTVYIEDNTVYIHHDNLEKILERD